MSYFVLQGLVTYYPTVLAAEEAMAAEGIENFLVFDATAHMAAVPLPQPKGTPILVNGNWVEQA